MAGHFPQAENEWQSNCHGGWSIIAARNYCRPEQGSLSLGRGNHCCDCGYHLAARKQKIGQSGMCFGHVFVGAGRSPILAIPCFVLKQVAGMDSTQPLSWSTRKAVRLEMIQLHARRWVWITFRIWQQGWITQLWNDPNSSSIGIFPSMECRYLTHMQRTMFLHFVVRPQYAQTTVVKEGPVVLRKCSKPLKAIRTPQKEITCNHMRMHWTWCKPSKYCCVPSRDGENWWITCPCFPSFSLYFPF